MNFLSGKKTYITAVIGIILAGAVQLGYIDQATFVKLTSLAGFLGLAALRQAVK